MDLDVTTRRVGPEIVVAATGEIDLTSCGRLRDGLAEAGRSRTDGEGAEAAPAGTVVDLTAVGFIDSTGLSVLVEGARDARADGRTFGVVADGHLRELLRITGLDTVMSVHADLTEALAPAADTDEAPSP